MRTSGGVRFEEGAADVGDVPTRQYGLHCPGSMGRCRFGKLVVRWETTLVTGNDSSSLDLTARVTLEAWSDHGTSAGRDARRKERPVTLRMRAREQRPGRPGVGHDNLDI